MAKNRKRTWLLWPENSHTADVFARLLESGAYDFSGVLKDAVCEDGEKRTLYVSNSTNAWFLWRSRIDAKFGLFCQEGENGKIRNLSFLFRRERRRPKKIKH